MPDTQSIAEELKNDLGDNTDATVDEIEEALENLLQYQVPLEEAKSSLRNKYGTSAGNNGNGNNGGSGGDPTTQLAGITEDEQWVDVNVKVVDLWEPRSESISQVGLVGDESGTMKFVAFNTSDLPELEEGKSYKLSPVVTDEYEGRYSIKLNTQTDIEELDEDLEVDDGDMDITLPIVDVQDGSGLIKRCPKEDDNGNDCNRPLNNGRCNEHGEVDGDFDLRIKGVADNGNETIDLIFDRERTENLTGMTLDEAKQMATDAMDTSVVSEQIEEQIVGHYFHITGRKPGDYLLVEECDPVEQDAESEAEALLAEVDA